ncbi:MAG: PASTA domain-containing protein [Clostridiales bacterium]|nr:PASTA domain-containing protein [Clostridiales bacterium]
MGFYKNLCPGCMNEVGDAEVCPFCGFDLKAEQQSPFLAYGSVIAGKYVIGDVLEQNSEGVTYLGLDTITNNCVRVREFLPFEICTREKNELKITPNTSYDITYESLRKDFLSMWHALMKLKNSDNLISVLDVFEANNTVYAIAEADGNMTLADYLSENGNTLSWDTVKEKLLPVTDALTEINNAGLVHGCISPDTLFLCGNGKFKPWGFSIRDERKAERVISTDIRPGYAAIEQYANDMQLTPATDVYGFCATLYRCVTGSVPIDAEIRSKEDTLSIPAEYAKELPDYVLHAFLGAMQVQPKTRTQDIQSFKFSLTREGYESLKAKQNGLNSTVLVDPLSDIKPGDLNSEQKTSTVVTSSTPAIPVLKKDAVVEKKNNTAATILMCFSIIFVMIIFFICLVLTGIITINTGGTSTAQVVTMPDFTNRSKDDEAIVEAAEKYGFNITLQPASSSTVSEDLIFEQSIAAGTQVAVGTSLILTYSKGVSTVTLPNFIGMTFTESVYYLGRLNLSYNIVEKKNTGSGTAGQVASMTPAAGSVVYEETEITLEIWGEVGGTVSSSGTVTGSDTGSEITSSDSILDSIYGSLSDSVSSLRDTIESFLN